MVKSIRYTVFSLFAIGLFALGSCHKSDIQPRDNNDSRDHSCFEKGDEDDENEGGMVRDDDDITITDPNHDEDEDTQIKK